MESEKQTQPRAQEWQADVHLVHVARYLTQEFELRPWQVIREAERMRPLIREALVETLLKNLNNPSAEIWHRLEDQIED